MRAILRFHLYALWVSLRHPATEHQRQKLSELHHAAAREVTLQQQERLYGQPSPRLARALAWLAVLLFAVGGTCLCAAWRSDAMSRRSPVPPVAPWSPAKCPQTLGVTLASGPGYDQLAVEAAARWRRHTGLPATIITADVSPGYSCKLWMRDLFPGRRCVFFDSDLWLLSPPDLSQFHAAPLAACWDPGTVDSRCFTFYDSRIRGLTPETYFNTGFFVADFGDARIVRLFDRAEQLLQELAHVEYGRPKDQGEQSCLNWAAAEVGMPWRRLPDNYNFFIAAWREGNVALRYPLVGMHAAAVSGPEAKLAHLRAAEALFTSDPLAHAYTR